MFVSYAELDYTYSLAQPKLSRPTYKDKVNKT